MALTERGPELATESAGVSDHRLSARDGTRLHLRRVSPAGEVVATAVYLHGIASHGGWFVETALALATHGIETIAPDRRGSGLSGGERGHLDHVEDTLDDIGEVIRWSGGPTFVLASSWAAKAAIVFAARQRSTVRGLVLLGAGLFPRVGLTAPARLRVALGTLVAPRSPVPIPLTPEHYTDNPAALAFIRGDRLRLLDATAGFFWATHRLDQWRASATRALDVPLLLQMGERDAMMDVAATASWLDTVASADRTVRIYPGAGHTLDFETDPARYRADLAGWILDRSPTP
jgi:alpha-beta hydrolase superfamily lysophospholipase